MMSTDLTFILTAQKLYHPTFECSGKLFAQHSVLTPHRL